MRQMLLNPRLAGFRVYRGELLRDADGQPVKDHYEAVLDVETWEYVVATISVRKHGIRPLGKRKYLLAGIARCAACTRSLITIEGTGVSSISASSPAATSVSPVRSSTRWLKSSCAKSWQKK